MEKRWSKYESMLEQEELIWFQKARNDCINFRDKNSWYFHASTIIRRKKNKIESLKDENGM